MPLISFKNKKGKERTLLSVYILHTLSKKPKTGYSILKEIEKKTEKTWSPSKGTIYPLLKQLEKEKLTEIKKIGKRSKNIYQITKKGKETLKEIKKHKKQMEEKINQYKNLLTEIINEDEQKIQKQLIKIRKKALNNTKNKRKKIEKILDQCIQEINGIKQ